MDTLGQGFIVRRMTEDDLDRVVSIGRSLLWSEHAQREFMNDFGHECSRGRVMLDPGQDICAFLLGRCGDDFWHLLYLVVAPAFRVRGLGGELLDGFIHDATASSVPVVLEVATSNSIAIALYRSRGFRRIVLRRRFYADGGDALVMYCGQPRPRVMIALIARVLTRRAFPRRSV